eukprot:TRINITY_DN8881_c0_g1_i1.p1 TRINITY_DN8881_c0_g1~~TRINITY_DN8881_c0_g1_i1.p1  ORF type:complete len:559 (-),score=130.78 TRINITY_DN8881_c0_g1_i1:544-2220(-)
MEELPPKRPRTTSVPDTLADELLSKFSLDRHRSAFLNASPFPHDVLLPLCKDSCMRAVHAELTAHLSATFKETDLFKLQQTGELALLDELPPESAAHFVATRELRDALYSVEFRSFIQEVSQCGPLTARVDCAANFYSQGHHLLCHDDGIGTRRISYIIYLSDPDDEWTAEDGGALELYPSVSLGTPDVIPTRCIVPKWNSMAFFIVSPGVSFHAVQEVYTSEKRRLSIQGWFHAAELPANREIASIKQLTTRVIDTAAGFAPLLGTAAEVNSNDLLSSSDRQLLAHWLEAAYLKDETLSSVAAMFASEGSVQLHAFLRKDIAARLRTLLRTTDEADALGDEQRPRYDAGMQTGWMAIGPPIMQRYLALDDTAASEDITALPSESAESLLRKLRDRLFRSAAFGRWLQTVTGFVVEQARVNARRFRPGLDYTVAFYKQLAPKTRLDATLCFVDPAHSDTWNSGDVGAFECYIPTDDPDNAIAEAEVYRGADDESGLLSVSAAFNTLNLVCRDSNVVRFVKYVSAAAPGSRWDISAEYEVEPMQEEEQEEQDAGEAEDE